MTEGFANIITLLEQRKSAIDQALAALREVDGFAATGTATPPSAATPEAPARKKFSAAVRRRMKEAQRLRWAKVKGESEPPPLATLEAPKAKRKLSAAGRAAIAAAMKKRWALKRAEAIQRTA
jgi:hypothetical protein